jgi:hypothetical protein
MEKTNNVVGPIHISDWRAMTMLLQSSKNVKPDNPNYASIVRGEKETIKEILDQYVH